VNTRLERKGTRGNDKEGERKKESECKKDREYKRKRKIKSTRESTRDRKRVSFSKYESMRVQEREIESEITREKESESTR
jgi:hypothetical protein